MRRRAKFSDRSLLFLFYFPVSIAKRGIRKKKKTNELAIQQFYSSTWLPKLSWTKPKQSSSVSLRNNIILWYASLPPLIFLANLSFLISPLNQPPIERHTIYDSDDPRNAFINFCFARQADLLVVNGGEQHPSSLPASASSSHLSGLSEFCLHNANCPVVIVKGKTGRNSSSFDRR